jgi:hypothetical protein
LDPHRNVNPYIAGSPVTGTEMFFGREDVFSFIQRNLIGRHRDTPIVLYGQRRTGKTSVLYQLRRHLDSRYRCIFIDLHGLSLDGAGNLMWGIANSISRGLQRDYQLKVSIPDRASFFADPVAIFETEFLDAVWLALGDDYHLVLMIDEAVRLDEEVRAGRLNRDIFSYLRHLMQHFTRLDFIFSLGSGMENMEKDYALLFSVSLYRRISFLEPAAARALITRPVRYHYQVLDDAIERILRLTSGHPYYIQLICHCMFDRWARTPKPEMTVADVDAVLAEAIERGSANLTYVWEDSAPGEQAMMAGMAAAMQSQNSSVTIHDVREAWRKIGVSFPEDESARAIRSLTGREVVTGKQNYSFAVDLQRIWVGKHWRLDWVKERLAEAIREWDHSGLARPDADDGHVLQLTRPLRRPQPRSRRRLAALTGIGILAAGGIVAAAVLASAPGHAPRTPAATASSPGYTPATPPTTTSSPSPTSRTGSLIVSQLQVGDCLTGADLELNKTTPWPKLVQAVPCSQGHSAEVFYSDNTFWHENSPYPGDSAIKQQAKMECDNAYASYVGIAYAKSIYTWTNIVPDAGSWPGGDRALHCVAYYGTSDQPAGKVMHGSIKDTAK